MLDVNSYFDGNVKSIAFQTATLPATVGVMAPGEYTFDTSQQETMTVVSGYLVVQLPGADSWERFEPGQHFVVSAGVSFDLKVEIATAYLCTYG